MAVDTVVVVAGIAVDIAAVAFVAAFAGIAAAVFVVGGDYDAFAVVPFAVSACELLTVAFELGDEEEESFLAGGSLVAESQNLAVEILAAGNLVDPTFTL